MPEKQKVKSSSQLGHKVAVAPRFDPEKVWFGQSSIAVLQASFVNWENPEEIPKSDINNTLTARNCMVQKRVVDCKTNTFRDILMVFS